MKASHLVVIATTTALDPVPHLDPPAPAPQLRALYIRVIAPTPATGVDAEADQG